jgi:uncharacterized protein
MEGENLFTPDCIRTVSGIYVNVFEPTAEMICIEDIAHALSMQCRFGGHLPFFYSVAQHSLFCCDQVDDEHKLAALLHDASEAYLLDIPRPIKNRLANYKEIENGLMYEIANKFGFQWPLHEKVKEVDELALQMEWDEIMLLGDGDPTCMDSQTAKDSFLNQFLILSAAKPTEV